MNVKLIVVSGDAKPSEIQLKLPTILGRGREAKLTLPHPLISRQHCEIFERGGALLVRDLGSLNGTFVSNQRITEAPLANGELLTVGSVTFRVVVEAAASEVMPPTKPAAKPATVTFAPTSTTAASLNAKVAASSPHTPAPVAPMPLPLPMPAMTQASASPPEAPTDPADDFADIDFEDFDLNDDVPVSTPGRLANPDDSAHIAVPSPLAGAPAPVASPVPMMPAPAVPVMPAPMAPAAALPVPVAPIPAMPVAAVPAMTVPVAPMALPAATAVPAAAVPFAAPAPVAMPTAPASPIPGIPAAQPRPAADDSLNAFLKKLR